MTRKQALATISAYAADGNEKMAIRLYTENRVSYDAFRAALAAGRAVAAKRLTK